MDKELLAQWLLAHNFVVISPETKEDNDLPYACKKNFLGQQLYAFSFLFLHTAAQSVLDRARVEFDRQGLKILLWDCYRPYFVQSFMADVNPKAVKQGFISHPESGEATHVRGIAVDLTLVDARTGEALDMGTDFDECSPRAYHIANDVEAEEAEVKRENGLTRKQIANRKTLRSVMTTSGFEAYELEWWHYNLPIDSDEAKKAFPKVQGLEDFASDEIKKFYAGKLPSVRQ